MDDKIARRLLDDDEWVMKATIPEAAGTSAAVHVLPTSEVFPIDFNDDGQLYTDSWREPGVVLPVIPYGKLYQLVFNNPDIEDFYVSSMGYGGAVADIGLMDCFPYEHKYTLVRPVSESEPGFEQLVIELDRAAAG